MFQETFFPCSADLARDEPAGDDSSVALRCPLHLRLGGIFVFPLDFCISLSQSFVFCISLFQSYVFLHYYRLMSSLSYGLRTMPRNRCTGGELFGSLSFFSS